MYVFFITQLLWLLGTDLSTQNGLLSLLQLPPKSFSKRYVIEVLVGFFVMSLWVFRAQEPKAPVTYCDHALSGVCRPSSVVRLSSIRQFTFSTSSPEPLDGF